MQKTIVLFLLVISGAAFAVDNADTWVGFKPSNDQQIPAAVRTSSASVFEIIYPHGEPEIKDVSHIDVKTMAMTDSEWFKVVQVKVCQNQKIKNCPIMPKRYSGTAFLANDKQTIVTNLHNVQNWLYYAVKNNPGLSVESLQAPFLIADDDQNVIFNAMETNVTVKLSYYNKSPVIFAREYPWQNESADAILFRVSDYVELHASAPSSRTPLKFATVTDRNELFYSVGFPNETHVYASHGGTDAIGNLRVTSVGRILARSNLNDLNFETTNAGAPGSSGSPLLNSRGEVVGILFNGSYSEAKGVFETNAGFLQTQKPMLESVWQQFGGVK